MYRVAQETFPQGTGYPASQWETVLELGQFTKEMQ